MMLMGNNWTCKIIGIGTISPKMSDGVVRDLTHVRYVPKLKRNLISIRMLDQLGCTVKTEKKTLKIIKG